MCDDLKDRRGAFVYVARCQLGIFDTSKYGHFRWGCCSIDCVPAAVFVFVVGQVVQVFISQPLLDGRVETAACPGKHKTPAAV